MKKLPSDETTFSVKVTGSVTGRVYEGSFTYKLPDLLTETNIEKMYSRLTEGLELRKDIDDLQFIVSHLYHTLSDSPKWWSEELAELKTRDFNVYLELHNKCREFDRSWSDEVWNEKEDGDAKKS